MKFFGIYCFVFIISIFSVFSEGQKCKNDILNVIKYCVDSDGVLTFVQQINKNKRDETISIFETDVSWIAPYAFKNLNIQKLDLDLGTADELLVLHIISIHRELNTKKIFLNHLYHLKNLSYRLIKLMTKFKI